MNNTKVHSIFYNLEKEYCQICSEVDNFVGSVLQWADELGGIVEKEFQEGKESSTFQLPKTPCEKKTRNRKPRNGLVSKCSVINSTVDCNEITNLDDTISTRTRGARRAATSKMSQFNITKECGIETKRETRLLEKTINVTASNATFVVPQTAVRGKSDYRTKQQEATPPVPTEKTESPKREPVRQKPSRTHSGSPPERQSRRKISKIGHESPAEPPAEDVAPVIVNETPVERPSRRKTSRTISGSPVVRISGNVVPKSPSKSPATRSSSLRNTRSPSKSPARGNTSTGREGKSNISMANRTVTIKKEPTPNAASTFIIPNDEGDASLNEEERTPRIGGTFSRISKTSTPVADGEKTPLVREQESSPDMCEEMPASLVPEALNPTDATYSVEVKVEEESEDAPVPKKKRKLKKEDEILKENIEDVGDTVRITRTKSKAIKQMLEESETRQADLSNFAKKLLNRAKMTSLKKNQLAALMESNMGTPTSGPPLPVPMSKPKYHLLLSSSKKLKTPLATVPNSAMKTAKPAASGDKAKATKRDSSVENPAKTASKPPKDDALEREIKLKSKKEKEEEAALKRQNVIKSKQEELKRKNELKHQMAMKQREKLEQEKYNNMIQSEKEKEERHRLILQERQMKLKEEAFKKKMITQQKIAETVERRRMEEEARIAKLKEMEAEEQRLALEKQREQERQEKRAQERLAEKKAREEYELKLKQELEAERLRSEKMSTAKKCLQSASKLQSANKRQKFALLGEKREWDYRPRNENDYGLEDEHSEVDSDDEKSYKSKPPIPWGKRVTSGKSPLVKILTLEMLCEFMPCYQKSPDIYKMFKMTPSKRIKRSSSAIWNTPIS